MAIRYDKVLNKEISRVLNNYNAKVRRLERNTSLMSIPDTITKRELKASVNKRRDLQRKLNELKAFSKRGMEQNIKLKSGVNISKYDYYKLKKESKRLKLKLNAEIKRYTETYPKVLGKRQAVTFARTADSAYLTAISKRESLNKDISKLSAEELTKYGNLLQRIGESSEYYETLFKNKYLDILTDLGYFYKYDNQKLEELKKRISALPPDEFYRLFREDKAINAVMDYYHTNDDSSFIDPELVKEDVYNLYDNIYDNLDEILKDYA